MTRPRVLMVTGAYYPELSGGALQIQTLMRALGDRVQCLVLSASLGHDDAPRVVDGVPVHRVTVTGSATAAATRLAAAFLRLAPGVDIVQLNGFSRKSVLLMALATALDKRRVVKLSTAGEDEAPAVRVRSRVAFAVYRRADLFVGINAGHRALHVAAALPEDRFVLIPNGVDLDRFPPVDAAGRHRARTALGLPANVPLTMFVGLFTHDKQPRTLFDAWRGLGEERGILLFVGATRSRHYEVDPALADGIKADAAAAGLRDRVLFVELADPIAPYYQAADVFAMPSRREGLPNVLLEAMASGLPSVASRLPGVTDWVIEDGTSGVLVPPGNAPALREALARLLRDATLRSRLGEAARARVARDYSIGTTADRFVDVYRGLLASRARRML